MNLIPGINISFNSLNRTISVQDITGFYSPLTNLTGYGGPNIARSAIINATVVVLYGNEPFHIKDVTTLIKNSTTEIVDFGVLDAELDKDGVYKIFLTVNSYRSFIRPLFVNEEVNRLMSMFWSKLAGIHDIYNKKELEEECIWLESNIQGLSALERRGMESEYINLLRFIEKRFEVNQSLIV